MADPTTTKQILLGYRRMIAATLKNAVQDARHGDQEAANWLQGEGLEWLAMLGIRDPEAGVERLLDPPGRLVISIYRR